MADLSRALVLDPKLENGNLARASIYLGKGDAAAAMPDLDRALVLNPRSSQAYAARCWAHSLQHADKAALADCDAAVDADPDNIEALLTRATVDLTTRQPAAAIRDYSAMLKRKLATADALYGCRCRRSGRKRRCFNPHPVAAPAAERKAPLRFRSGA